MIFHFLSVGDCLYLPLITGVSSFRISLNGLQVGGQLQIEVTNNNNHQSSSWHPFSIFEVDTNGNPIGVAGGMVTIQPTMPHTRNFRGIVTENLFNFVRIRCVNHCGSDFSIGIEAFDSQSTTPLTDLSFVDTAYNLVPSGNPNWEENAPLPWWPLSDQLSASEQFPSRRMASLLAKEIATFGMDSNRSPNQKLPSLIEYYENPILEKKVKKSRKTNVNQ